MVLSFNFVRGLVFQSLMNSFRVVKRFDVFEDAHSCIIEILILFKLGPLMFQGPEKSFDDCVVVTAPGTTHGAGDVGRLHDLLKRLAGVLTSAIAVME